MSDRNTVPSPHEFSDEENNELLRMIYCYVQYYDHTEDSITGLVTELAQSQWKTTDAEDRMRGEIEQLLSVSRQRASS